MLYKLFSINHNVAYIVILFIFAFETKRLTNFAVF
nr:MAG TPA: hypothetical protein [Microviridae sp.]